MRFLPAIWLCLLTALPASAAEVDYLKDIKPLLSSRCSACHGALRQKSGLRLDAAELIRKGGKNGPAIAPGKSGESLLIDHVTANDRPRMPPESEGSPLTAAEVALLRAWIDQGAKAPNEPIPPDARQHWSFTKPVRPAIPAVNTKISNPIDAFVAAELHKQGLQPVCPADKRTLLRRVYIDLIGLPPTRAELHAFLADESEDAYEKIVDRLLASPRYGERWGRHWMDVWRYSDWFGRRQVPDVWNSAPQIWRWRDWIVKSLNDDRGYDQMVKEMLAADEIAPGDDSVGVATGFLVRNWYALNPNQWLRDNVEHTGKAFLGLTFNCAHCHDHRYDPISQEEYFRFRAFFEPIQLRQDRVPGEPDPGPFQKYEYVVQRKIQRHGLVRVFDERLDAETFMYQGGDERVRFEGRSPVTAGAPAFLNGDRLKIAPVELPTTAWYPGSRPFIQEEEIKKAETAVATARSNLEDAQRVLPRAYQQLGMVESQPDVSQKILPPRLQDARSAAQAVVRTLENAVQRGEFQITAAQATLQAVRARITADRARFGNQADAIELAKEASKADRRAAFQSARMNLVIAEQSGKAEPITVAQKALAAAQQALTTDSDKYTPLSPVYPTQSTGRRKALAEWIAHRDNPLTARVAVNHIWLRHFGQPLVPTVYDFGRNGKPPTHPELLDWLAMELMGVGGQGLGVGDQWQMKRLHRLIVTSATYRQSSQTKPIADGRQPIAVTPRRLEAEVLRDSVLHLAGVLDSRMGGQELEVDQEAKSNRRSLYFSVHPEGGGHLQFLGVFDPPDPCECYRRTESIVPQQALALTNSELLVKNTRVIAAKFASLKDDEAFITAAFETVLTRLPTAEEKAACREFLRTQEQVYSRQATQSTPGALRARESLLRVLFNHDEFVTVR
jgi:hypothetical protein